MASMKLITMILAGVVMMDAVLNAYGRSITIDETKGLRLKAARDESTSVKIFARHALCSHLQGQKFFYEAMKEKLCGAKDYFVMSMVTELCARRDYLLEKWVAEIFDIDGDGYIASMEVDAHAQNS